jgi:hypothetical protein|tara:strand:- start:616 stop:891 length:276 start_codon:yes stop_codon:yes gene_type:complete
MEKLKNQLAGIAALVGVLGAIGAGFVTYGEMQEKINSLAGLDLNPLLKEVASQNVKIEKQNNKIAVLEKTIEVLELNIQELKAAGRNPLSN